MQDIYIYVYIQIILIYACICLIHFKSSCFFNMYRNRLLRKPNHIHGSMGLCWFIHLWLTAFQSTRNKCKVVAPQRAVLETGMMQPTIKFLLLNEGNRGMIQSITINNHPIPPFPVFITSEFLTEHILSMKHPMFPAPFPIFPISYHPHNAQEKLVLPQTSHDHR